MTDETFGCRVSKEKKLGMRVRTSLIKWHHVSNIAIRNQIYFLCTKIKILTTEKKKACVFHLTLIFIYRNRDENTSTIDGGS